MLLKRSTPFGPQILDSLRLAGRTRWSFATQLLSKSLSRSISPKSPVFRLPTAQLHFHPINACWLVPTPGEGPCAGYRICAHPYVLPFRVNRDLGQSGPTPGTIRVWDISTRKVTKDIDIDDLGETALSGIPTVVFIITGRSVYAYDTGTGEQLYKSEILPSISSQLGAHWTHDTSFMFARSSSSDRELTISIHELRLASKSTLHLVKSSFSTSPLGGKFSFSPVSSHAAFVTETEILIFGASGTLLGIKEARPLYVPPGCFSQNGSFFACTTLDGYIHTWKNTPAGYVLWNKHSLLLVSKGFTFSPLATSILSWGREGLELSHQEVSADGTRMPITPRVDNFISRRVVSGPGKACFRFPSPRAHRAAARLLRPDMFPGSQGDGHQRAHLRGCFEGTRNTVLDLIKSWINDTKGPPTFWLNGLVGTGKSAVAQTIMEWCIREGKLGSYFFCPRGTHNHRDPPLLFPSLAIQLAQQHPRVRSVLIDILRSTPHLAYMPPSDQVERLMVTPLRSADVLAVIVIDGFDGWMDEASRSAVLYAMEKWTKHSPKVKFLVTSRPETLPPPFGLAEVFVLHDIAPDLVNNDIRAFLKHELSGLAARREIKDWPTPKQLDLLCDRADGLFMYATATVNFLSQEQTSPITQYEMIEDSQGDTAYEGKAEQAQEGFSLDSLCISVLQESLKNYPANEFVIIRSVLAVVVLASPHLPPRTIADLTGLDVREVASILELIQSLLRVQGPDRIVRPFHRLLSDLLTSPTRCTDARFYISPGKFHSEIALNCLNIMNESLEDSLPSHDGSVGPDVEKLAGETTFNYACTSWHVHLAESKEDIDTLIVPLRHFLERKVGIWAQVVSSRGYVPGCALQRMIPWLREVCLGRFQSTCHHSCT